jgi:pilus assembly protein Flp/PilA
MELLNNLLLNMVVRVEDFFTHNDEEDGQTMVEYGLIIALVSIVAIATLGLVGTNIKSVFNSIAGKLHS